VVGRARPADGFILRRWNRSLAGMRTRADRVRDDGCVLRTDGLVLVADDRERDEKEFHRQPIHRRSHGTSLFGEAVRVKGGEGARDCGAYVRSANRRVTLGMASRSFEVAGGSRAVHPFGFCPPERAAGTEGR
jgi:hypothetical protein